MVFALSRSNIITPRKRLTLAGLTKLIGALALAGCASVTPPDGGERDTIPPRIIQSVPENGSVNVAGREITLVFTEPVTTDQLTEQLTITPAGDIGTPRVTERDNRLTLVFPKPFAPNTTYSVNLGSAVVDVTERNKSDKVALNFSTGTYLDTGRVAGNVKNLLSNAPLSAATVGLYPLNEQQPQAQGLVDPGQQNPQYFTRTTATGAFSLESVKPGDYRLIAFVDANKNQRYDEPELIAYSPRTLQVGATDSTFVLLASRLDTRPPIIASRQERQGTLQLQFNEGVRSVAVRIAPGQSPADYSLRREGKDGKQVTVFGSPSVQAQRIIVTAQDSAGNQRADTLAIRFSDAAGSSVVTPPIEPEVESDPENPEAKFRLIFPTRLRIAKQQLGSVVLSADSAKSLEPVGVRNAAQPIIMDKTAMLDSTATILTLTLTTQQAIAHGKEWVVRLDSSALVLRDIPGRAISSKLIKLPTGRGDEGVGSITIKPQTQINSFALELLNTSNATVRRFEHWRTTTIDSGKNSPPPVLWDRLPPGTYRVRILLDVNRNGRWDGADRTFSRSPEPVLFGPAELVVRANWEQEATIAF